MCQMSVIADQWTQGFQQSPLYQPNSVRPQGLLAPNVSAEDFAALKKEVTELRELLKAAGRFDAATGQPHCEKPDKLKLILWLAEELGVDMKTLGVNKDGEACSA
jgi:hypothetical protein